MRSKIVKYIFKKEMLDILRDKKTLFMMIVVPLLLYPLLMLLMIQVMNMSASSMNSKDINIAFNNKPNKVLVSMIEDDNLEKDTKNTSNDKGKIRVLDIDNYKKSLEENKIDAYIKMEEKKSSTNYQIYINSSQENSSNAVKRIETVLDKYKRFTIEKTLSEKGLDVQATLEPITYSTVDVAKTEEVAGYFLGQILPFILIIGVLLGSIYPAIDVMAGEKERGTLETLFTLPISNLELVMGKYMAVSLSAIVTAILNILSMGLTMAFILVSGGISSQFGFGNFNYGDLVLPIITTLICICLFSMVVSAISMCVCSLAKSFKDAQNYITPLMLIIMIPSYVSMIPNIVLDRVTAVIPVVNISLLIKSVLSFKSDLNLIALVLASNVAFVILAIILLSKMFNSEEILFGNSKSFSFLEKRSNIKKGSIPTVSDGVILYAVGLVLLIYVGSLVQIKFGMTGIIMTQFMIISLPLLFAYYIKADFKEVFSLKVPKLKHVFGSIVLWIGGYILIMIITQLILFLFPQNMEVAESLNKALFIKDSVLLNLLVIALLPAICEEMFFRGFIFSSFSKSKDKNKSIKLAVICSGVLFGIMHMDFVRIIPTSILGIIFAYSVYKSGSIFVSMLLHFLNNSVAVVLNHYTTGNITNLYKFVEVDFSNLNVLKFVLILLISLILVMLGLRFLDRKSLRN
ncbi:ABC transporter permease subunit/CPBP intramembrane protease [Clostridioides difficile]|uniref:ABC transporter permease subunit/CPBP intramembrane protease n=1 Tax=Clostridioides difficile TaxID=1496 RepID=UPI001C28E7DA|nr:CPBP family intramembrane metalloprotease [Clostridioides difficile]HDO9660569.1 CPBP family intramembrane metalloprotease [Clostridioides difficile]